MGWLGSKECFKRPQWKWPISKSGPKHDTVPFLPHAICQKQSKILDSRTEVIYSTFQRRVCQKVWGARDKTPIPDKTSSSAVIPLFVKFLFYEWSYPNDFTEKYLQMVASERWETLDLCSFLPHMFLIGSAIPSLYWCLRLLNKDPGLKKGNLIFMSSFQCFWQFSFSLTIDIFG